jgi:tRNA(adenine34) deaminase
MGASNDRYWMQQAINVAKLGMHRGDWPFGAVIIMGDVLVTHAHSIERATGDPTGHGELLAIRRAGLEHGRTLNGCTLYTTHEPCVMCAGTILQAKISRVVIGTRRADRPDLFRQRKIPVERIFADARVPPQVEVGVMKSECLALFEGIEDDAVHQPAA